MPKHAILFGLILIAYGIGFYVYDSSSWTALIPSIAGLLLFLLGLGSNAKPNLLKHLMHVAALVALLGMIGSFKGIPNLIKVLQGHNDTLAIGHEPIRELAAWAQSGMFLILLVFLILCIRSFVVARLIRKG